MKYGFIYIWFDKKQKMFYIGSRWGNINDGYICSSKRMKNAYNKRPDDFKRRIIKTNIDNKNKLLEEEYRWLSFIQEHELTVKYYNVRKYMFGVGNKHKWNHTDETKSKMSVYAKSKRDNSIYQNKLSVLDKQTGRTYRIPCVDFDKNKHESLMFKTDKKVIVIDNQGNRIGITKEQYAQNKQLYTAISSARNKGRLSVNNGIKAKRIKQEELEVYLSNGWQLGWPKKEIR